MVHAIRPTRTSARCGFTLIELLIVVTIILVLVSLSVAGVMKVLNLQQRRNTEQTVSKLDKGLAQQWKAVIDTAKTEQVNPIAQGLAGNDALGNNRARVIHILMCLRREFPTNFTEATQTLNWPGVGSFAPNPAYVRALSGASAASLGRPPEDQSSACLYLALKQRRRGIDFDPDTGLSSGELYDRFNDGLKEISDGWQRTSNPSIPIIFNRWPASGYGAGVGNPPTPAIGTLQPFNAANPPDKED
ncbi:MAG TPA: prepilin-type N-terminal cleavage/methylation domain-containing protein, partial [Gemmataceae bacterium]|nr:prepilin-type N-terminal cleavage/methylation domain-containing protein [Gemmataceae bacterium]